MKALSLRVATTSTVAGTGIPQEYVNQALRFLGDLRSILLNMGHVHYHCVAFLLKTFNMHEYRQIP
jgi:hypothetical protein